jgi:tetratricopeptide (TPR) repeat protein
MKNLYGTLAFFIAGVGTFRLIYGVWPPTEGDFGQWLYSDIRARWAMVAGILAGMLATAIGRAFSRTSPLQDSRLSEASQYAQRGLMYHEERRIDEAITAYQECGCEADAGRVHASLGKLYFDIGEMDLAEAQLKDALARLKPPLDGRDAVTRIQALLELISERRQVSHVPVVYTDPIYSFSFTIPADWVNQKLVDQFAGTGGRGGDITHLTRRDLQCLGRSARQA